MSESLLTIPYYRLPDTSTMMYLNKENPEGYFGIDAGHTHIFPFTINVNSPIQISASLRNEAKEDESLCLWISDYPMKYTLFPKVRYVSPMSIARTVNSFILTDDPKSKLCIKPNKLYFINIQNLQNTFNEYGIMIDLYNDPVNLPAAPFY